MASKQVKAIVRAQRELLKHNEQVQGENIFHKYCAPIS